MDDLIGFFNTYPKCMATSDNNGIPNVCLTGAAQMIDENTIVLAGGFIDKSIENIRQNGKATFMPWSPMIIQKEYWQKYNATGEKLCSAGYRFYCSLKKEYPVDFYLKEIQDKFRNSIGNRIPDGLKYTVTFRIDEIREIEF